MQKTMVPSDSDTFWQFSTEYWFEKLEASASDLFKKRSSVTIEPYWSIHAGKV